MSPISQWTRPRANRYMTEHAANTGAKDTFCTAHPIYHCVIAPAAAPRAPPKPEIVPTTCFGNTSAGSVMFPQAAWPNIIPVIKMIASVGLLTLVTRRQKTGMEQETASIVLFLARPTDQPRLIRKRGIAPLEMFPAVSAIYGIQMYRPTSARANPRSCWKYFGVQKKRKYEIGSVQTRARMQPHVSRIRRRSPIETVTTAGSSAELETEAFLSASLNRGCSWGRWYRRAHAATQTKPKAPVITKA